MGKTYRKEGDIEKRPSTRNKKSTNSKTKKVRYEEDFDDVDLDIRNIKY